MPEFEVVYTASTNSLHARATKDGDWLLDANYMQTPEGGCWIISGVQTGHAVMKLYAISDRYPMVVANVIKGYLQALYTEVAQ